MRSLKDPAKDEDFMRVFELGESWGPNDLKASFLKMAKKYHPDANPGNRETEAFFKFINQAYEALSRMGGRTAAPKPVEPPEPPVSPKTRAADPKSEMISDELHLRLQAVIRSAEAARNRPVKLSRGQKIAKWFKDVFNKPI